MAWREQGLSREGLVALTFLSSLGLSLRPLDLEFMKHLSKVVNIIPVIAKADTMTLEEKSEFKQRVSRRFALFLSRGSFPSSESEPFPSSGLGLNRSLPAMASTATLLQFPTLAPSHLTIQEARARSSWTKGTSMQFQAFSSSQKLPDTLITEKRRSHCSSVKLLERLHSPVTNSSMLVLMG